MAGSCLTMPTLIHFLSLSPPSLPFPLLVSDVIYALAGSSASSPRDATRNILA